MQQNPNIKSGGFVFGNRSQAKKKRRSSLSGKEPEPEDLRSASSKDLIPDADD